MGFQNKFPERLKVKILELQNFDQEEIVQSPGEKILLNGNILQIFGVRENFISWIDIYNL